MATYRERYPDFKFIGEVSTNGKVCVERLAYNRYRICLTPEPSRVYLTHKSKTRHFRTLDAALDQARKISEPQGVAAQNVSTIGG